MHAAFNSVSKFLNGLDLVLAICGLPTALVLVVVNKARLAYTA
jgi:hypothetical protein